jgi:3-phosphoshikimate 1-carboxyvinyltransferase
VIKVFPKATVEPKEMTELFTGFVRNGLTLSSYKETSLQGDSALVEIYKQMGVDSRFENNTLQRILTLNLKL